jgi:glycosyltransferase involved in cell wall biosynthesis
MHCLFICNKFPPQVDGVGDYTFYLSQTLIMQKYEVSVIKINALSTTLATESQRYHVYPIVNKWHSPVTWARIYRKILTIKPSFVILQYVPHSFEPRGLPLGIVFLSFIFRFLSPGKFLVFFHEVRIKINPYRLKSVLLGIPMWLISGAVHLLAEQSMTSNEKYRRLLQQYGKKAFVIPVGSNIPIIPPTEQTDCVSKDLHSKDVVLGIFGFGIRGMDVLCAAMVELKKEIPNLKLLALGAYSKSTLGALATIIDRLDLNENIVIPGYLSANEVAAHFHRIDIFLSLDPSESLEQWTGTGTKSGTLATAMGYGKPIIGVKGELTDEVLCEGSILLLDKLEVGNLVEATLVLASDPQKRISLGKGARHWYEAKLTWNAIGLAYSNLLVGASSKLTP